MRKPDRALGTLTALALPLAAVLASSEPGALSPAASLHPESVIISNPPSPTPPTAPGGGIKSPIQPPIGPPRPIPHPDPPNG